MKKIIDYCIVQDSCSPSYLQKVVLNLIKEGWQPFGGITSHKGRDFAQAMVKYEDNTQINNETTT